MILSYQENIPADFHPDSKVWIYQCSRLFNISEVFDIETMLNDFTDQWKSHGAPVKSYANLFFGQFILLMADESSTKVGGCSTDSSVHLIKNIEQHCKVDLFNRQNLAFLIKDKVQLLPLTQLNYAWENGFINGETLYFNNLVATKKEFLTNWMVPINQSWLKVKIKSLSVAAE